MTRSGLGRAIALGLSATVMGALALVGATPAMAADTYSISGTVETAGGAALEGVTVSTWNLSTNSGWVDDWTTDTGAYEFTGFVAGDSVLLSFKYDGHGTESTDEILIDIVDQDEVVPPVTLLPVTVVSGATAEISGAGLVGGDADRHGCGLARRDDLRVPMDGP